MKSVLGNCSSSYISVQMAFCFKLQNLLIQRSFTLYFAVFIHVTMCDSIAGQYDRSRNATSETTGNVNACNDKLHKNFGTAFTPNEYIFRGYDFLLQAAPQRKCFVHLNPDSVNNMTFARPLKLPN